MTKYIKIQPEVIIGLGERTEFLEKKPPFNTITKLHIQLEDWLGDDLMLNSNCYIVTKPLKEALEKSDFTGFEFSEMEVTKDEYFDNNFQLKRELPSFYWMKIIGDKDKEDMYMYSLDLYCSDSFLDFLRNKFQIKYLDVDPIHDKETDDFIMSLINKNKGLT